MPKNDIGGFFLSLGMNIDKGSFETGNRLIDGVGNSFNKLIGSARNAALVLAGTATVTGAVESSAYKTATALGVSTDALNLWRASAKIAGVSADALVSSIGKVAAVQNRINYNGEGLDQLQTQLNKLGMSYSEIEKLTADEATQKIIERAQSKLNGNAKNDASIFAYLEDILGAGARDFLIEINREKLNVADFLAGTQKTMFTTSADTEKGADFARETNTLRVELESIGKLIGDSIGGELTGPLSAINKWIQDNGPTIKDAVVNISELVGRIADKVAPYAKDLSEMLVGAAAGDTNKVSEAGRDLGLQLAADITGSATGLTKEDLNDINKVSAAISAYSAANGYAEKGEWVPYEELPEDLKAGFDKYAKKSWGRYRLGGAIKDGIMRPDGTVTQVAPDDWVFAARNIGDMARAFVPQNHTSVSGGEYTINQTFNISGGSDMPQVLRQQAYNGTRDGLLQMMEESSRRLQLMSGTR